MTSFHLFALKGTAPRNALWIAALSVAVLLIHGYHPGAEDGGIYATGVYLRLHPALFPHDAEFVRAPMAYSAFAFLLAGASSLFHVSPEWALLLAHLATTALTLFAVERICRVCGYHLDEQITAMALLAAWWTLPVAGTSLTIGDPYLTARSFSLPFSLLAISFALECWHDRHGRWQMRPVLFCIASLVAAAVMHRLMFGFAALFVLFVRANRSKHPRLYVAGIGVFCVMGAMALYLTAPVESPALVSAELTRQYWFLSDWRWFEVCGLLPPLLLFACRLRYERCAPARELLLTAIQAGLLSVLVALLFAREGSARHLIARLQPLRMFTLLYLFLGIELSGVLVRWARAVGGRARRAGVGYDLTLLPLLLTAMVAGCMYFVQIETFSSSRHIDWPLRIHGEQNPWVNAFLWCRQNTRTDALFAIDPTYIHLEQNDAQTFRAHAWRSVLPDQSKDGGEAAVAPELAKKWEEGYAAQLHMNTLSDKERLTRLQPFGVTWLVLGSKARTGFRCPYRNQSVKVCSLG